MTQVLEFLLIFALGWSLAAFMYGGKNVALSWLWWRERRLRS